MKTEMLYLIYVIILTALLWIPYIIERLVVQGMGDAVGYPEDPKPASSWAQRLKKAHYNSVENLVLFASLVLAAHALGVSNSTIGNAAIWYFWARLVYAFAYTLAIPWVRTISFTVGWIATLVIAWQLLP